MTVFRTARQRYFLIAGLMLILFCISYVGLFGFLNKLSSSAEKVRAATAIDQEIRWLGEHFWKLRFWEKVVQARSHPEADQQFGVVIERIRNRMDTLDLKPFDDQLSGKTKEISLFLARYEESFNRLIQLKTEQRLNRTQVTSTYQMLSSAILFSRDSNLLKSLLNMHFFLDRYINSRNDSEYQALEMVFEFLRVQISQSALMNARMESYMMKFDDLIQHHYSLEKKVREINHQFDEISGELMMLFENISGTMENLSRESVETSEQMQGRIQHQFFISAGTALLILIYIINFIAKNLVNPIRYMSQVVMRIKAGDDQARFIFPNKDEIAQLGAAVNEMLDIIHQHRHHLESLVEERTEKLMRANEQLQQEIAWREQATIELQKAQKAAEDANLAKSMFLANMSHEIRTPMNAILGFSEILMNQIKDPAQKKYSQNIHTSGKGLLSLINDILDLSKIEAGKLELTIDPMSIRDLLDEIRSIFLNKFQEKELGLKIEIAPDMPGILFMDEVRVRQILINLVGNALKFTARGYVSILAGCRNRDASSHRIDLIVEVEDTGIGIPEDQQSAIFEAFQQQKNQKAKEYGGTGLGLTITRRLVEMMNGKISVKSGIDMGSRFLVVFSEVEFKDGEKTTRENTTSDLEPVMFDPAVLLVVDDVQPNRELIKGYLQGTPITIIEADSGEYALRLLDAGHTFDLILMDLRMPGRDGYEITKKIKSNETVKPVPVIACTAAAMKDEEKRIATLFDGYLRKPVGKACLIAELKRFLSYQKKPAADLSVQETSWPIISDAAKSAMPELIQVLDNEFMPRWNSIKEMFYLDEISDFARDAEETGRKYGVEFLAEYGKRLSRHVQSIDIDEIEKVLGKFSETVDRIKAG
jgi:signal transduction histidine kinase/DNA-binding NarL/FixJ family response regulator